MTLGKKTILTISVLILISSVYLPIVLLLGDIFGSEHANEILGFTRSNWFSSFKILFPDLPTTSFIGNRILSNLIHSYFEWPKNYPNITFMLMFLALWILLLIGILQFSIKNNKKILCSIFMLCFFHYSVMGALKFLTCFLIPESPSPDNTLYFASLEKKIYFTVVTALLTVLFYKIIQQLRQKNTLSITEGYYVATSVNRRIIGRLIDLFLIIEYGMELGRTLVGFIRLALPEQLFQYANSTYFVYFIAMLFFYIPMEYLFQATPAKELLGTRVVTPEGEKPTFSAIVQRTFCRIIPLEGILFLANYRLHDNISETTVYDENSPQQVQNI